MIYILASTYRSALQYAPRGSRWAYLASVEHCQGLRFERGDEIHELSDFADLVEPRVVAEMRSTLGMAMVLAQTPPVWKMVDPRRESVPDLRDRPAVEAWLDC